MGQSAGAVEGVGVNAGFWNGKRVFLTGHTGFKGSWLSLWLQSLGARLTGYALQPATHPSLFEEARIADGMCSVTGDIRDAGHVQAALRRSEAEIVIHMAAQSLVGYSYLHPAETWETNVMGTVHLLEAVRHVSGVKAVINVTSDKCYENREWVWGYREQDALGGHDPYSNSKACAELVGAAYRASFFSPEEPGHNTVALASVRSGNVIGGGDRRENRLIPDILAAFDAGRVAVIRNPRAVRPWQYVLDALRGYLMLAESLYAQGAAFAEAWNFGPDENDVRAVSWVVKTMSALWGNDARWEIRECEAPFHETVSLKLDASKSRARLNWCPVVGLQDALKLVVAWTQQRRRSGADVRGLTLSQIHDYRKLVEGNG